MPATRSSRKSHATSNWPRGPHRARRPPAATPLRPGERLYFTWTLTGDRRIVHTIADDAGLEVLKKEEADRVDARLCEGRPRELHRKRQRRDRASPHLLQRLVPRQPPEARPNRSTSAPPPRTFTPTGDPIDAEILTRKNLGTYGSGASELTLRLKNPADAEEARRVESGAGGQYGGQVIRSDRHVPGCPTRGLPGQTFKSQ